MEIHFAYAAFKKDFYLQKTLSYDLGDSMKLLLYFKLSAKQLLERRFIQLSCDMRILLAIEMSVRSIVKQRNWNSQGLQVHCSNVLFVCQYALASFEYRIIYKTLSSLQNTLNSLLCSVYFDLF